MSSLNTQINKNKSKNKDKGNWRFSFYQKKIIPNEEQNIKKSMEPENGFDPNRVKDYINPEKTREEVIKSKVENGEKINTTEKIIYENYLKKQKEILKEDLAKIEIIKQYKTGDVPQTNEGKLKLLLYILANHVKKNNIESICNFYLKINKEGLVITPEIYKENKKDLDYMEKIINQNDLIELQFTKFHDTMPPLNQNGFKKFDDWQVNVINNIDNSISTVVSAPTSAGKTVLAGYAATKGRTMFIAPTDALCWQIASYVGKSLNADIPIITATFNSIPKDSCDCKDKRNRKLNKSCSSCTRSVREKILEFLDKSKSIVGTPDSLLDYIHLLKNNFDWIVMDEIHMIGKEEGSSMEIISKAYPNVNFLALSATIGNLEEITNWFQKINPERKVQNILCDKRFFNLQKFAYSPNENELNVLNPLALVNTSDFENGAIIKKNLQPTPLDTWILYSKLKEEYDDLGELDHTKYFEIKEIVHFDKANKYFKDLIKFMVDNYDKEKISNIIDNFKNVELGNESINLVKLAFLLKEKKITPAIIFQKNTLACLRLVRSFAKEIERMENEEFPNLMNDRERILEKVRKIDKDIEKVERKNKTKEITKVKVDSKGNVKEEKISKTKVSEYSSEAGQISKSKSKISFERKEGEDESDPYHGLSVEGLNEPHEKYILNTYQHFKQDYVEKLVEELKPWFPYGGGQYHFIIRLLWRGVGVYTKGLPDPYLRLVQKLTSEKKLAILFSDMSLVFGVSMPFKTSVIYRDTLVADDLDPMLYHQMAGRAGRRGLDKEGNVIFAGYSWNRIEDLSICPIPNIVGVDKINLVVPQADKISKIIGNSINWEKIYENPLKGDEEEQIELLEQLKSNYRINLNIVGEGWKFAYKPDDINHMIMMWSLRNSEGDEPIIIAYLLPYIKRGFESMDFDYQQNQVILAQFLCNFISIKRTTNDKYTLQKCSIFSEEIYEKIYSDFDNLGLDITSSTKIDNSIWESIKFNKMIETRTEGEANDVRERLLMFAQKVISIQHYFYETKTTNLAKLFAKLLTRIWWIYHTSSPIMKRFNSYDEDSETNSALMDEYESSTDSDSSDESE